MSDELVLLQASAVSKRFGATQALADVDLQLRRGEIHALLGENGAGKSTLVKILSGTERLDSGRLRIGESTVTDHSPALAAELGLFVVHQELSLVDEMSIAENIFLNRFPRRPGVLARAFNVVDRGALHASARKSLRVMNFDVAVDRAVRSLDQAGKQIVEICRALAGQAKIILLDEPTSSLAPDDRRRLYERIRAVAQSGVAVVIITHNLEEALEVADRITVLRDGRRVATLRSADARVDQIIELMTGMSTNQVYPDREERAEFARRLVIEGLAEPSRLVDVSLNVGRGEIVGLAGLVGAGRTEVMKSIFGLAPRTRGSVTLDGEPIDFRRPDDAIRAGLFMISEDRQGEGIIQTESILSNMAISNLTVRSSEDGTTVFGVLRWRRIREICDAIGRSVQLKAASLDDSILTLSGGNQQKVILGRCIMSKPRLILADEPTRGVSIGSKVEIYKALRELAESGVSILIASSEFDELVGLCNRIYIMDRGCTVEEVENRGMSSNELLNLVLSAPARRPGCKTKREAAGQADV